ncbi:branched-chain amino acid ABC transporter permease [Phytohabitans sp. ZYX-F-186]|uniref:Branched-chain amino acid ABC transporter permease n=1 Tax=Phytohabitans maris TaxID=3071409 RepID=A0ABU0ZUW4_9ACTN|nr:branched-chain amino acid ABC transporter permease [Phytohabitans sp. ZYX-F-186]MDQ7910833.1 branched-chain amino acid ABC transporter permease [Phytohabitans sp. ZYX-F-186]
MASFIQDIVSGIATGSIYGLVAIGLVLVYKSTGVFNFAHGEFVALSAFLLTSLTAALGAGWLAIVAVLVIVPILGVLVHYLIIRPMMGKPLLATVMTTIGLGLALRALILILYGPDPRQFDGPIPSNAVDIGSVRIAVSDLLTIGIAVVCLLLFGLFFTRSSLGLQMRAVANQMEASILSGVNASRIYAVAFGVGALLAAVAGVLLASTSVVSVQLSNLALIAFPAVIIGGISSVQGAIVGGILVGVLEKLAEAYASQQAAIAVVYAVLLAVLLLRPQGILGTREAMRA